MAAALSRPQLAVVVLAATMAVTSALVPLWSGLGPPLLIVRSVSGLVFIAAGALTWSRGASVRLGWLFLLAGCAMCLINLTLAPDPVLTTLRVLSGGYALFGALLMHLLIAYPDGRLRGTLDRVAVGYGYLITGCYLAAQYLIGNSAGQRFCAPVGCDSIGSAPIASDAAAAIVPRFVLLAFSVALVLLVLVMVRHWRTATPTGRRLFRPVLLSLVATVGLAVTSGAVRLLVLDSQGVVRVGIALIWGVTVSAVAVALLLGVLRNRLVLYGVGPLVTQFGTEHAAAELTGVLARLLDDPSVQLVRVRTDGGFTDLDGTRVDPQQPGRAWLLIEGQGAPVGAIVYDAAVLPDPKVVAAVVGALRLVLDNLRLQDRLEEQLLEVEASRTRIVAAADAERRRVERDLHDGAQQHLVASALTVRRARDALRTDPQSADQLLVGAESQLRQALIEIRDLARGLHPAVLTEEGIGAAVESLSDRLPIRVDLDDRLSRRYPSLVETTAYFVVCEALVNVVKHAATDAATVALDGDADEVRIEVGDTGRGGAKARVGSGLTGLEDRLAAAGGRLAVASAPGQGTLLRAVIPAGRLDARGPRAELT